MKKILTVIILFCSTFQLSAQGTLYDYGFEGSGNEKYVTYGSKWNNSYLKYYIDNISSHLTASQREHAIQTALNRWSLVTNFTFEQVYSASNADLKYAWKTGSHAGCTDAFDGPGNTLGHAKQPTAGVIHFDDDENWCVSDTNPLYVNLVSVALHETGHALGLNHSADSTALMWETDRGILWPQADDVAGIWALYGCPWQIVGDALITDNSQYSIQNFPNDAAFSVHWSINDTNYNSFIYNSNSPQCLIYRNPYHDLYNATLTATIKCNNVQIAAITKHISAYIGFKGTYNNGTSSGEINYPNPLYTQSHGYMTITSPNFYGATLTHQGGTPSYWNFDSSTGILNLGMPSSGVQSVVVHAVCPNSGTYDIPILGTLIYYSLSISMTAGLMEITLVPNEEYSKIVNSPNQIQLDRETENLKWILEVFNASTGEKVFSQEIDGSNYSLDTSSWESGLYIVRVTIDDEVLSEKIVIK
jgi:hypothetical protein